MDFKGQLFTNTFSLSVLISFLSSLFLSFPGASAVGKEEWKMNSFPGQSAAWGGKKRVLGGKFYFKGLRKVKYKYFL